LSKLINGLSQTFKKEEGIMNPKKIFVLVALVAFVLVISLAPAFALTVTSPNGGEVWEAGSVHDISWSGGTGTVDISYSTNSGQSWLPVANHAHNDYSWTIPDTPSPNCRVRVVDTSPPHQADESDGDFTITGSEITVTSPNGGENWGVGITHYIQWTSEGFIDSVKIDYSTNSGLNWIPIDTVPNPGALKGIYPWFVPNTPSANCRVRVSDYKDGVPSDSSNNDFAISKITVLSPNGGEYWCVDSTYNVLWNSNFFVDNVKLEYTTTSGGTCSGGTWLTIINSTDNDGIYQWTIPNITPSTNCKVRVSDAYDADPCDVSDTTFTIGSTAITVTAPNGGEQLCVGTIYNIRWNTHCFTGNLKIEYSTNGGSNWNTIIASTANDGIYEWTVPNTPSANCLVRICDAADNDPCDVSNNVFTITQESITVTSPNGGEVWCVGSNHNITWNCSCVDNVKIDYSTDGGSNWIPITASTPCGVGTYSWNIPNTPSSTCKVRICDASDNDPCDTSNSNFAIRTSSITVSAPNGGEQWNGGYEYYIQWSSDCFTGNVRIDYSVNSGASFDSLICSSCPNTGEYLWKVPCRTSSDHCRVRVCDAADCVPADTSDADFTISFCVPVLTNYGIIVLLILLMGTAVWMIRRKKLATERNN
jgi:hypothetical protein